MGGELVKARIDGGGITLITAGLPDRIPSIVYWGRALPDEIDIDGLYQANIFPVAHAGLDEVGPLSLFPEMAQGDYGTPALEAFSTTPKGAAKWATRFTLKNIAKADPCRIIIHAEDAANDLELALHLTLDEGSGILRAKTQLINRGDKALAVHFLSCPVLPLSSDDTKILSWHGRWCAEFTREVTQWHQGIRIWESRQGRTSHETFPGIISASPDICESSGHATAIHLAHSGNWRIIAEESSPGARRILSGALYLPGEIILAPGSMLETPAIYASKTDQGLNGASHSFHEWLRKNAAPALSGEQPRPVHYNSWEALYFNLNIPDLLKLIKKAAEVGAERFVIDDGWFKGRHGDHAGLGDWMIDRDKFPNGFDEIVKAIQEAGMSFGLWVEPEMVNPDSDLYRAHPDWVLGMMPHPLITGRKQLILDIARVEVSEYLFQQIDAILSAYPITYLKWDMNRPLYLPARDSRPVAQEQVGALYDLMARLRNKHPNVDIESCSSGGGRMDFAIAKYCHRFWLSDNNDTYDRWAMAREASHFFPPEMLGFHVGPSPCHTSGRKLDMIYRAFSAALCGHMGMELDLISLSDEEIKILRQATDFYKMWRAMLHRGRHHRLELPPEYMGHLTLSSDGKKFLAGITQRVTLTRSAPRPVTLDGLKDDDIYCIKMASCYPSPSPQARHYKSPLTTEAGYRATGRMLKEVGFRLPPAWPDQLFILEGHRAE